LPRVQRVASQLSASWRKHRLGLGPVVQCAFDGFQLLEREASVEGFAPAREAG